MILELLNSNVNCYQTKSLCCNQSGLEMKKELSFSSCKIFLFRLENGNCWKSCSSSSLRHQVFLCCFFCNCFAVISLHNVSTNQPVPFERIGWSVFKKVSRWEDFLLKIKQLTLSSNPWLRILTEWLHQFWDLSNPQKMQEFHVCLFPNSSITKEEEMVNWE